MIEVRNFAENDTEIIAFMPDLDSAVAWCRAVIDLGLEWQGDVYAVDERHRRTLMTSEGGRSLTAEEWSLLKRLIKAVDDRRYGDAQDFAGILETFLWPG